MMLNHHRRNSGTEVDMLHGTLWRKLLLFAVPLAASSILQQLFNSVDGAIVGKFASSEALAAVGTNIPVISLFLNLFVGISLGTNVVIANFIGQRKRDDISKAVTSSMLIALVSGLALVFLGWIGARPILLMMGTPAAIVDKAVLYLRIYMLGAPFILLYNFGSAILRSMGDSSRPLYVLIVAGIINTLLNLVMVVVFHMDVAGVAIATTVSNVVSAGVDLLCNPLVAWLRPPYSGLSRLVDFDRCYGGCRIQDNIKQSGGKTHCQWALTTCGH